MITEELTELIKDELSIHCSKDENGMFFSEIYPDYRDELGEKELLKICNSDAPQETFDQLIDDLYQDSDFYYVNPLLERLLEAPDIAEAIQNGLIEEDDIRDYLNDIHYVKLPYDHYLKQEICVDILVNAGDMNYDYTLNTPFANWYGRHDTAISEDSALLWLARQQGYTKTSLTKALRDGEHNGDRFLKSVLQEVVETASHMSVLTFLSKMELKQWLELNQAIAREAGLNNRYLPRKSKGRGYLVIDKSTTCGLYDPWQGAGGMLEIALQKDVRLPFRMIESIRPDGGRGYSVKSIYGVSSGFWSEDAVKEIHPMKKTA